ncbi:MAG: peptidylprolyl isomerase [Clostridiales Family XIII bacterium]|nr:peptidylprolyl isomerase [Clostridiales Family XIII bacterium]
MALAIVIVCIAAVFVAIWQVQLGGTLAKVNGTSIRSGTVNGLDSYLEYMQTGQFSGDTDPAAGLSGSAEADAKQTAKDTVLVQDNSILINVCVPFEAIKTHFENEGKTILTEEKKAEIKETTDAVFSSADTANQLRSHGVKKSHVAYYQEYVAYVTAFQEEVLENGPVTDEDAQAYYDEHPDYFTTPLSMQASHILVSDPEHTPEKLAEAESILEQIKDGADFAELANEYSDDGSGEDGGDLGTFGAGQMVEPFEEAALALEPGEVSDIVETEFGYHIIKLAGKTEESVQTLEEARETIDSYVGGERTTEALDKLVEESDIQYSGLINPETGKPPISLSELESARNPSLGAEGDSGSAEGGLPEGAEGSAEAADGAPDAEGSAEAGADGAETEESDSGGLPSGQTE